MFKNIRAKLLINILPFVICTLVLSYYISVHKAKEVILTQTIKNVQTKKAELSTFLTDSMRIVDRTSFGIASTVGNTYSTTKMETYTQILSDFLSEKNDIVGIGIFFEPNMFNKNQKYASTYITKENETIKVRNTYIDGVNDYFSTPFYVDAKEKRESVFRISDYDETVSMNLITNSCPIYDENNNFIGVVCIDYNIATLQNFVNNLKPTEAELFIINQDGYYIRGKESDLGEENNSDSADGELASTVNGILNSDEMTGTLPVIKNNEKYILIYDTINILNWKLIYFVPERVLVEPIRQLTTLFIIVSLFTLVIIGFAVKFIVGKIVYKPIELLLIEFEDIANDNFTEQIPEGLLNTNDEFSIIGQSLGKMKTSLIQSKIELENQNNLLISREAIIQSNLEYNKAIIDALPQLLFIFSKDGYIVDCQGAKVFASKPPENYIGMHIFDIIKSNDCEQIMQILQNIKEKEIVRGINFSYEVDGEEEYFIANLSHCTDDKIIFVASRVTELHKKMNEIEYLLNNDPITEFGNRRSFEISLSKYINEKAFPISLISCDINGLKIINDSFGQYEGDKLLVKFANVLKRISLENCFIARTGGDEFAVILPNTEENVAKDVVEKLSVDVSKESIHGIELSVAFGLSTMNSEYESIMDVIKRAEDAMYQHKIYESSSRKDNTIEIINKTLQAKNPREQLHSNRVGELCEKMAKALEMSKIEQNKLKTAGLVHDIGKIGISEELLNKPGKLTDEEYKLICKHPEIGYRILESSGDMKEISEFALSHHEKWDGTGYPRGIKEFQIPLEARIIAIADTYDAMTSDRSYRKGLPKEVAIEELIRCKGTQFEPYLVDIFIEKVVDNI